VTGATPKHATGSMTRFFLGQCRQSEKWFLLKTNGDKNSRESVCSRFPAGKRGGRHPKRGQPAWRGPYGFPKGCALWPPEVSITTLGTCLVKTNTMGMVLDVEARGLHRSHAAFDAYDFGKSHVGQRDQRFVGPGARIAHEHELLVAGNLG
jgi:hypothetical protein